MNNFRLDSGLALIIACFRLSAVSERVYKEYDQLKNRYEVETGAMHQAMQRASEVSTVHHSALQCSANDAAWD